MTISYERMLGDLRNGACGPGWTQAEAMVVLGCSLTTVRNIERGKTVQPVRRVARVLEREWRVYFNDGEPEDRPAVRVSHGATPHDGFLLVPKPAEASFARDGEEISEERQEKMVQSFLRVLQWFQKKAFDGEVWTIEIDPWKRESGWQVDHKAPKC